MTTQAEQVEMLKSAVRPVPKKSVLKKSTAREPIISSEPILYAEKKEWDDF